MIFTAQPARPNAARFGLAPRTTQPRIIRVRWPVTTQGLRAMDADEVVAASRDHEAPGENVISTEVLIIGFGFSAIPLLRELERNGIDHLVVSAGDGSIWDKLERHGRLDFDMVSSMHTSISSFELAQRDTK